MKATVYTQYKSPDILQFKEVEKPTLTPIQKRSFHSERSAMT